MAISRSATAVVAVLLAGGCSGAEEQEQVFTAADATRIAEIRPVAPDWTWPRDALEREPSGSSTSESTDALLVELERRMADVVDRGNAGNKWRDDDKLGNLSVGVFGSAADAREAMAAMNEFSRGWGVRSGSVTKDEEVDDLGDDAWRLWTAGSGTQVTYHWRRGNLVLEAHVHCFGSCPGDVDAATRAWVDAIDEAARGGS